MIEKIHDSVLEEYGKEMKDTLRWRHIWKKISRILFGLAKIITIMSACVSFVEPIYKTKYLSLIAGIITLSSALISQFAEYSANESKKRTNDIPDILMRMKDIRNWKNSNHNLIHENNISDIENNKIISDVKDNIELMDKNEIVELIGDNIKMNDIDEIVEIYNQQNNIIEISSNK